MSFLPLWAATPDPGELLGSQNLWLWLIPVFAGLVLLTFFMMLSSRYKRCPATRCWSSSARPVAARLLECVHGGAAFVWPLIQDYAYLSLEPIQIEIPLKGALSMENIRVNVPSVFTVAIGTEPEMMQNAAIRLLGLRQTRSSSRPSDIIFGQLRQVIASMRIEDINRDREQFLHNIQNVAGAGAAEDRPGADQRQHHRHHRRVGLHRGDRPEGGVARRCSRPRSTWPSRRSTGRSAWPRRSARRRSRWPTPTKLREIGTREAQREQAVRVAQLEKERRSASRPRRSNAKPRSRKQRQQAVRIAELEKEQKVGEQTAASSGRPRSRTPSEDA